MKILAFCFLMFSVTCIFAADPSEKQDVVKTPVPATVESPVSTPLQQKTSVTETTVVGTGNRDCSWCPQMVEIPRGSFVMGAKGRQSGSLFMSSWIELPQHDVTISTPFSISKYEITVSEYLRFTTERAKPSRADCPWLPPGAVPATMKTYPVVCVSKKDAEEYTNWLTEKTGFSYRLPSESEWEYVARSGSNTIWYWGDASDMACSYENVADESYATAVKQISTKIKTFACNDEHLLAAPVGTYSANSFGLHDVLGNVREWVADCWLDSYHHSPTDGSAVKNQNQQPCRTGVHRGGSFVSGPQRSRAAYRLRENVGKRSPLAGFRVVREVSN